MAVFHNAIGGTDLHDPKGVSPTPLILAAGLTNAFVIQDTTDYWLILDTDNNQIIIGDNAVQSIHLGGPGSSHATHVNGYLQLHEEASAPASTANSGMLYAADVAGVTQLRYRDSAGTVHSLTPPAGAGTSVSLPDDTNLAYQIYEGANPYFTIHTDNNDELVVVGGIGSPILFTALGRGTGLLQYAQTGATFAPLLQAVAGAHTTLTASTEAHDVQFDLSRTVQFATGAIAAQRAFSVDAPTYAFVGPSTITDAATVAISGAPVAGSNATLTRSSALLIGVPASTSSASNVSIGFRNGDGTTAFAGSMTYSISASVGYLRTSGAILGSTDTGGGEVFGFGSRGTGTSAVALGRICTASGSGSLSVGTTCSVSGLQAIAFGNNASVSGDRGIAICSDVSTISHSFSIAIGEGLTSTATNQLLVRCNEAILGRGDSSNAPPSITLRGTNASTSNTDLAGGSFTITPGRPTGAGAGGHFIVSTAAPGSTGTTLRTATNRLRITDTGTVSLGGDGEGGTHQRAAGPIQTTDAATNTTLLDLPISITNGAGWAEIWITVARQTTLDTAVRRYAVHFEVAAGAITINNATLEYDNTAAGINTITTTVEVSGSNLRARVNGIAGLTLNWHGSGRWGMAGQP